MYQERSVSLLEEDLEEELLEDQVALEELVVLVDSVDPVVQVGLEVRVDMVVLEDLEEEVAVESDMEVVVVVEVMELELEDLLITERMTLDKMKRIFKSVKQTKSIFLNPDHLMKPSFSPMIMRTS